MTELFENGVHDICNERYHSSLGLSRSALWVFKKSPALYWHQYLNPDYVKPEQTPSMLLGSMVHTLTLEPDTFPDLYVTERVDTLRKDIEAANPDLKKKDIDLLWAQEKESREQYKLQNSHKTIVTHEMIHQAKGMSLRLFENNTFVALLDGAKVEQSIYFTHDRTGLQCKVRPDIWLEGIVTDLKTTDDASPRAFQSSAYKFGYYLQAAMLSEGLRSLGIKMDKLVFACVEKKEPYLEALYVLDQDALDFGINQFNKLMDDYAACLIKDEWPGYGIQSLSLPAYAQIEE